MFFFSFSIFTIYVCLARMCGAYMRMVYPHGDVCVSFVCTESISRIGLFFFYSRIVQCEHTRLYVCRGENIFDDGKQERVLLKGYKFNLFVFTY